MSAVIRIENTIWELPWGLWMSLITTFSRYFPLSSVQELRDDRETIDLLQMTQSLVKDYALLAKERELQIDNSLTHQQAYLNPSVMKLILSNLIRMPSSTLFRVAWLALEREKGNFL